MKIATTSSSSFSGTRNTTVIVYDDHFANRRAFDEHHSNGVIEFMDSERETVVVLANEADGFMAQSRDGRFACTQ